MNNKFKFLFIFLFLSPMVGHSDSLGPLLSGTQHGIQIVADLTSNLSPQQKKQIEERKLSEKKLGYIKTDYPIAQFLLTIKDHAKKEIKDNKNSKYGEYDTHLKADYSDIKLAFPFHGIGISKAHTIGYAAVGTYLKNRKNTGWTGIRVFFDQPGLGVCSYLRTEIQTVLLLPEDMKNLINKKPSTRAIEGNTASGFLYTINWYTDNIVRTLECANLSFSKEFLDNIAVLANKIDKYQST